LDADVLLVQLRRKRVAPAYLLLGSDAYLRDLCRNHIVEAAVPAEARGLAVFRFSLKETSLAEILRQAQTLPMLSPRQVFVIDEVERAGEADVESLEDYLGNPNVTSVLIFEASTLDRRTRLARMLLEKTHVIEVESPEKDRETEAFARQFAEELGMRLEPTAAEELVFVLGGDLSQLRRELEKLRAYVGAAGSVGTKEIAALVEPARKFNVFEVGALLADGRQAEALGRVRRLLAEGENPIGVVGALAWLFRQLLQAQELSPGSPVWQVRRRLRPSQERAEAVLRQARRFRPGELAEALGVLAEADWALKSSPSDPVALLETVVIRLSRLGKPAPKRPQAEAEAERTSW